MNRYTNLLGDKGRKRRGRIEVIASILEVAKNRVSKTRLVYKANLNFALLNKYLSFLIRANLIREIRKNSSIYYETTEKGRAFLSRYRQLRSLLEERPEVRG
ncbi:MAG TPA: transcriptional regulator [Candidatus Bathyarchaeota archaeon]|nr:transcriptional regulator [Candidatus Bathyarchaeota archaeon]